MRDFFDRLVTRAGFAESEPAPKVRPRLPNPFERAQPLEWDELVVLDETRATAPEPETAPEPRPAPPRASAPPLSGSAPAPRPAGAPPERRGEVRAEPVRRAQVTETVRQVVEHLEIHRTLVAPAPVPPDSPEPRPELPVARANEPVRPSVVDKTRARPVREVVAAEAARDAERRGEQPAAERVVRVTIGKLAVTAAGAQPPKPPPRTARPAPEVGLDRYLARRSR
ncbi:hypothetical protein [Amycolatopsis anabasis]|uniref:hypothetical protein n=1 Tax=Amycolatopsis anabasis TaxID=1840409 RepID=UPI00131DFE47|nr:hypothetical protein [Amycolatopsis anabasis]